MTDRKRKKPKILICLPLTHNQNNYEKTILFVKNLIAPIVYSKE